MCFVKTLFTLAYILQDLVAQLYQYALTFCDLPFTRASASFGMGRDGLLLASYSCADERQNGRVAVATCLSAAHAYPAVLRSPGAQRKLTICPPEPTVISTWDLTASTWHRPNDDSSAVPSILKRL